MNFGLMPAIALSFITFVSTMLGGLFTMRFSNKLHYIMGFTAGVLLGVVSFDIFPEIINQVAENHFSSTEPMVALVIGFLLFHILEKTIVIHHAHEHDYATHHHPEVGKLSAMALIGHSLMDGIGIGLGFQVSNAVGFLVALAVVSHDFTDGMNTVSLMLSHHNTKKSSRAFLVLDALAPVLGALSTLLFTVSPHFLVLYLGFFAGFLLYIGVSDILPEAHSQHSSFPLIGLTVAGVGFIFLITRFISAVYGTRMFRILCATGMSRLLDRRDAYNIQIKKCKYSHTLILARNATQYFRTKRNDEAIWSGNVIWNR